MSKKGGIESPKWMQLRPEQATIEAGHMELGKPRKWSENLLILSY